MWFKSREAGSMPSKHDESRRAFLVGAVIGAGAAGVGFAPEAGAQTNDQQAAASATTGQAHAHGPGHGAFFNDDDAATVAAFAERLMPVLPRAPVHATQTYSITSIWRWRAHIPTYRIFIGAG
jgi:hypothetical protein